MRKSQSSQLLMPSAVSQHNTESRIGGAGSESYSSASSFTDSYSDCSEVANWEEFVGEDGTLFYAEYMPHLKRTPSAPTAAKAETRKVNFTVRKEKLRCAKKLPNNRRQQQQPNQHRKPKDRDSTYSPEQTECSVFKFIDISANNGVNRIDSIAFNHLELVISASDRYRFGRRSTAIESILGFHVIPYPDKPECLMFHSFVNERPSEQQCQRTQVPIKQGDWFKSLNGIEVRAYTIDDLLLQFSEPTKVTLTFQGPSVVATNLDDGSQENTIYIQDGSVMSAAKMQGPLMKVQNFKMFAKIFEKAILGQTVKLPSSEVANLPFALLLLAPECYQSDQHRDSLYFYPDNVATNFLYMARGSFLTLNAVLTAELQTKPYSSKLTVDQTEYIVNYRTLNGFLVIIAYAGSLVTITEANLRADELIMYMRFTFPHLHIENFNYTNESSVALKRFLHAFCEIQRVRLLHPWRRGSSCLFEEVLKESRHMPLPKEAQLRIFDALSEMEAMDYRNWNDDPLNTHREFFIHGSVLYYDGFLLASQLPIDVRSNIECFLRCRGIFDFIADQCVKELYIWEEIEMSNTTGRFFLTVCSRSHLSLVVILKIFDAADLQAKTAVLPSLFYIEEFQETLDHLIQCGIESLAMFWSVSNKRPEVLSKIDEALHGEYGGGLDSRKLDSITKQRVYCGVGTIPPTMLPRVLANDLDDTHLGSSLGGSSVHSLTPSEDDCSKKQRNASAISNNGDSDSGSDWENFNEQNYGLDAETQSQMTESLWKEINNVVPVKICAGWKNAIFYYVYVDSANGMVFCPLKSNSEQFPFLSEMRKACHMLHNVLQNTKSYRRLLSNEVPAKLSVSKGQMAIKEYGITLKVCEEETEASTVHRLEDHEAIPNTFVVVGRLFLAPTKEVYVCHRPDVPQNMVEMAFRLSFFSVG